MHGPGRALARPLLLVLGRRGRGRDGGLGVSTPSAGVVVGELPRTNQIHRTRPLGRAGRVRVGSARLFNDLRPAVPYGHAPCAAGVQKD